MISNGVMTFFHCRAALIKITDEGDIRAFVGFKTKAYFKNPGLRKRRQTVIKVKDKNNPDIWGECEIEIGKTLEKK